MHGAVRVASDTNRSAGTVLLGNPQYLGLWDGKAETVDALGNVTTATFDAAGNQLSLRDANNIGWNVSYDARNRAVSMADTQEQAEGKNRQTVYDAHGNVVGTVDAKGQSASSAFDARDRRTSETDRLAGITTWRAAPERPYA